MEPMLRKHHALSKAKGISYSNSNIAAHIYHIRYSREQDVALSEETWQYALEVEDGDLTSEQSLATVNASLRFEVTISAEAIGAGKGDTVRLAVKAEDEAGNLSPISNAVRVVVEADGSRSGLSGGDIAGIVIGSVLGVFLLMVTVYFVATKIGCCGGGDGEDSYDFAHGGNARRTSIRSTTRRRESAMEMADYKNEA